MKLEELAALLLDELYQRRDEGGIPSLVAIARARGITNLNEIGRAAQHLNESRLLDYYTVVSGPDFAGSLNSRGVHLYEQHGDGRGVLSFLHRPTQAGPGYHYHGPVFQGDVTGSNVAIASPNAEQSIASGAEVQGLVGALVEAIRGDRSLPEEQREDALGAAETLKGELGKVKPNSIVLKGLLSALVVSATAAEYVQNIKGALGY